MLFVSHQRATIAAPTCFVLAFFDDHRFSGLSACASPLSATQRLALVMNQLLVFRAMFPNLEKQPPDTTQKIARYRGMAQNFSI